MKGGRPVVSGIVLETSDEGVRLADRFDLISDIHEDFAQQLATLWGDLQSKFAAAVLPDAVVVRAMDFFVGRSNRGGNAQKRFCAEGVILAVVRGRVKHTFLLTGNEIAARCGMTKDAVEAKALEVVPKGPKEAAAAALAALRVTNV